MSTTPVQSSNVTKLCTELGFSGAYPGREEKVLTAQTLQFPIESLSQSTPFPFFRADSTEAQQLAAQFCNGNRRGSLLWPDNTHSGWPTWSRERTKILRLIAHIFSLQAFYKYQKLCKNRKKQRTEDPTPIMESSQGSVRTRELSPESRKLVGPSPPKGTRRRPAKESNLTATISSANGGPSELVTETEYLQTYIEHVESLDPKDDEGPLRDFTRKWLTRSAYQWPTSADSRLHTYMHVNRFYDPDIEDWKELSLVNHMRHGSEIEQVQPLQYNMLKERILERVRVLAMEMQEKNIITYINGKLQMVKAFREVWDERFNYWAKKTVGSSANTTTTDSYGTLDLYDDEEDDCVPYTLRNKSSSKGKQPMIQNKNTSPKIPQRRKPDDITTPGRSVSNYFSPYPNKRLRTEPPKAVSAEQNVHLSTETINDQTMGLEVTHSDVVDAETAEHILFAEQVLRSPSKSERPTTPQPTPTASLPQTFKRDQPMTPTSPVPPPETIRTVPERSTSPSVRNHTSRPEAVRTKARPQTMQPSKSPAIRAEAVTAKDPPSTTPSFGSTSSKTSNVASARSHLPSPKTTPQRSHQEISLTLQNSDGTWDLDNKFPAPSYLRMLDLAAFFAFFSQRSGVPLANLNCLTFKLIFGDHPQQVEVIYKNSGKGDWDELKGKIRKFFKFVKNGNPRESEFDLWVEIGDKRGLIEEEDDDSARF